MKILKFYLFIIFNFIELCFKILKVYLVKVYIGIMDILSEHRLYKLYISFIYSLTKKPKSILYIKFMNYVYFKSDFLCGPKYIL